MENIILKSKKDLERAEGRPRLNDILSFKGFIRYFFYRNSLPGVRDLLYFVFDTVQIFLIYKLLGKVAFSGGLLGYVFAIFISNFWNVIIYSMREKTLELDSKGQLKLIPSYFAPLLLSGGLIWFVFVAVAIIFVNVHSLNSEIIFISRLLAGGFELYSSLYFFAVYTLLRVYIPFSLTIINRLIFLVLPLFLVRYIGPWAFAMGFVLEKSINLLITLKYCNKALRIKGVKLINSDLKTLVFKKTFWFLLEKPLSTLKRSVSFSIIGLQKLVIIFLVSKYYEPFLFDFFAFYQLLGIFLLVPYRISKSLYYDLTNLLYRGRFYMLRLLFNYNLVIACILGLCFAYLFSFVRTMPVPGRFFDLMFELTLMNRWFSIYMLVFFTFGISVLNRLLLVSESHLLLISLAAIFDYILLGWLVFHSPYFRGDPIFIFSFQGQISLYYFAALLLVYLTGIWKKESMIAIIRNNSRQSIGILDWNDFRERLNSLKDKDPVIAVMVLSKRYTRIALLKGVIETARELVDIDAVTRASNNTLFLLIPSTEADTKNSELSIVTSLGVYCDKILLSRPKGLLSKVEKNGLAIAIEPELFSSKTNIEHDLLSVKKSNLLLAKDILSSKNIKYKIHSNESFVSTERGKYISALFSLLRSTPAFMPTHILLKKDYLGLVPIIENGKLIKVMEIEEPEINFIRKLLWTLSLNEFYSIVLGTSND